MITRYLLAIVKSLEEKNKNKRRKTRVENPVAGLANDEDSDDEHRRRQKLPPAVFTKSDDGKKNSDEEPTRKAVLMSLFTKTGIAKVKVRAFKISNFLPSIFHYSSLLLFLSLLFSSIIHRIE
jgi:hypothetical protein